MRSLRTRTEQQLHQNITIPNSICFSPDRTYVYFADTTQKTIWKQLLDSKTGWPVNDATIFVNFDSKDLYPDGSVCDSEGYLWNAQFGASRIARYNPNGVLERTIDLPVTQITCPAFGGENFNTIYTTTAFEGLNSEDLIEQPLAGRLFYFQSEIVGLAEYARDIHRKALCELEDPHRLRAPWLPLEPALRRH